MVKDRLLFAFLAGFLALILGLACSSCATRLYGGERQGKENVARLKEGSGKFTSGYFVTLWEVNGQRVHDSTFGIDIPPGRTTVTVLVHSPPSPSNTLGYRKVRRTITAKAGYVYTLLSQQGTLAIREEPNRNLLDKLKKDAAQG